MARYVATAAALAVFAAAAASAQTPGPPTAPQGPVSDPMSPTSAPNGMESHEDAGALSATDQLERLKRTKDIKDRKPAPGSGPAAAAAEDIVAGSAVRDSRRKLVGTVESVEADGAIVVTAAGKVKVPLDAFGKDSKGLLLGITKAEFEKAVLAAVAAPAP